MSRRLFLTAVAVAGLALGSAACGTRPADLDLSLQHASAQGRFRVGIEPPTDGVRVNQLQAWQVRLATPDGAPVSQAVIAFDGGMPGHGHGFPTQPRVTRELAPGVYALEGMKFSMSGWWDLRLTIRAGSMADSAVFNVVVDAAGPGGLQR